MQKVYLILLMQIRAEVYTVDNLHALAKQLSGALAQGQTGSLESTRYGLVIASILTEDLATAEKELAVLLKKSPDNLYYLMAEIQLKLASGQLAEGLKQANELLETFVNYYPVLSLKAAILAKQQEYKKAADILLLISQKRPEDPDVWAELAEIQGLAKDIVGLHQSRAEYFFLTGNIDDAIKHITYAQKQAGENHVLKAKLEGRMSEMLDYRNTNF